MSVLVSLYRRVKKFFSGLPLFRKYPFNLYASMIEEVLYLFFHYGITAEELPKAWWTQGLANRESSYLLKHYDLSTFANVVVVGSGAIPYTALYYSRRLCKPTYCLERNLANYVFSSMFLRELSNDTIHVVRQSGDRYDNYGHSVVIIGKEVRRKQAVLERVLRSRNNIVVLRHPTKVETKCFETVVLHNRALAVKKRRSSEHHLDLLFISNQDEETPVASAGMIALKRT